MQPSVSQLNDRNFAVGAPATPTGDYVSPGVKNQSANEQTTIYSGDINDKIIPQDQQRLTSLSQKGPITDSKGTPRLADGSVDTETVRQNGGFYMGEDGNKYYNYDSSPYKESSAFTSDEQNTFNDLKKNLDATTKQSLDVAHQTYDMAKQKQDEIDQKNMDSTNASLLERGTTQYAPKDHATTLSAITKEGLDKVNQLNIDENKLIAQAQSAQGTGEREILNKKLDLIETVRKEKQARVDKLTDQITAHNVDLQKEQEQSMKDSLVAREISKGVTDPAQILKNIQDGGGMKTITAGDVSATLSKLNPQASAIVDLLKTAKNNGAPIDVIQKIGKAQNLDEAMASAGNYGSGGTGIIGEYNYAKANGYTGTFSHYQNEDANRKASAVSSINGAGGVSDALKTAINGGLIDPNKINSRTLGIYNAIAQSGIDAVGAHAGASGETKAVTDLAAYKSTANRTLGILDKNLPLVSALADKVNTLGIPGIDDYIRGIKSYVGNNPDVIKYVNSIKTLRSEYAQMLAKGSVATEGDKRDAEQAIPSGLSSAGYTALGDQLKLEAHNIISASNDAIAAAKDKSTSNSGSVNTGNADKIVSDDKTANDAITTFDSANPKNQSVIDALHTAFPKASALQIYQKLQARGLVQ